MGRPRKKRKVDESRLHLISQRDWGEGDLVLAKLRGYRPWPAQVRTAEDYGYESRHHKIFVTFFGTQEISFCSHDDIKLFTADDRKVFLEKVRGLNDHNVSVFEKAIKEICAIDEDIRNDALANSEQIVGDTNLHANCTRKEEFLRSSGQVSNRSKSRELNRKTIGGAVLQGKRHRVLSGMRLENRKMKDKSASSAAKFSEDNDFLVKSRVPKNVKIKVATATQLLKPDGKPGENLMVVNTIAGGLQSLGTEFHVETEDVQKGETEDCEKGNDDHASSLTRFSHESPKTNEKNIIIKETVQKDVVANNISPANLDAADMLTTTTATIPEEDKVDLSNAGSTDKLLVSKLESLSEEIPDVLSHIGSSDKLLVRKQESMSEEIPDVLSNTGSTDKLLVRKQESMSTSEEIPDPVPLCSTQHTPLTKG